MQFSISGYLSLCQCYVISCVVFGMRVFIFPFLFFKSMYGSIPHFEDCSTFSFFVRDFFTVSNSSRYMAYRMFWTTLFTVLGEKIFVGGVWVLAESSESSELSTSSTDSSLSLYPVQMSS